MKKKVTIREIAEKSGFSINTVSRALNGKEDIAKATQDKILEIAKEMEYVPNKFAQGLRSNKSRLIGIIVTNIANPFYSEIIKTAENIAREAGYNIMLFNSGEDKQVERRILKDLEACLVDGILITPVNADEETLGILNSIKIPYVIINRQPEYNENINFIVNNDVKGASLAVAHLCSRGVKTIHYIGGPENLYTLRQRIEGCKQAIKNFPGTTFKVHHIDLKSEECYKETKKILSEPFNDKIGIFAYNDNLALGAMKAIREAKFNIPNKVSLVGYDNITLGNLLEIPLTTVSQSSSDIGKYGIEILIKNLKSKEDIPCEHIILSPELVIRSST